MLSSAVLFAALKEAEGIPILMAAVTPTGHVILEVSVITAKLLILFDIQQSWRV